MPLTTAEREQLVLEHMPLVRAIARRYANRGEPVEELEQAGALGLVKAVHRFDEERGQDLAPFAAPSILGEIRRHFRDTTWAVHVPRAVSENRSRVLAISDELTARTGHHPSIAEIAAEAGLSDEETLEALAAGSARAPASLSASLTDEDGAGTLEPGVVDSGYEAAEARAALADGLRRLPARERMILHLRYNDDLTQSEIADRMGISQMHVSRLLRKCLVELGRPAAELRGPRGAALLAAAASP